MSEYDPAEQRARREVKRLKAFYSHLFVYILVNIMLIAINLITSPQYLWFYWVTIFWGIFVIWNFIILRYKIPLFSDEWEERKIQEIREKERK
ncbi:MAG: 2TM domain-containing protein [Methanocalculus sp.]|uniref:2TM domain-containing protein n=1 Tax=Methanocalculus sp. TaxID=2004547 RepID=UPI002719E477|nr:2TM domain-containing protein [Methanocalculus sp.]MDO9539126.1 2TM domain-containing protein [Methanocalculus sp.]